MSRLLTRQDIINTDLFEFKDSFINIYFDEEEYGDSCVCIKPSIRYNSGFMTRNSILDTPYIRCYEIPVYTSFYVFRTVDDGFHLSTNVFYIANGSVYELENNKCTCSNDMGKLKYLGQKNRFYNHLSFILKNGYIKLK